jgi:uncharacterized membrane protein YkvA (DUF1232 family)
MAWWEIVLVVILVSLALLAIAALLLWRMASAQTRRIAGRVQRLPWSAKLQLARALMSDNRIPPLVRAIPPLLIFYLSLPLDLLPDFIPVIGQIDDLMVVAVGVGLMLKLAPMRILESHLASLEAASSRPTPEPPRR